MGSRLRVSMGRGSIRRSWRLGWDEGGEVGDLRLGEGAGIREVYI